MNVLPKYFRDDHFPGVMLGSHSLNCLMYADDLLVLSPSPEDYRNRLTFSIKKHVGGTVASWLARSTRERRALRVRALAGDIVLCSWARHFTLMVPLSTQVYKWVPANLMLGGNPAMD